MGGGAPQATELAGSRDAGDAGGPGGDYSQYYQQYMSGGGQGSNSSGGYQHYYQQYMGGNSQGGNTGNGYGQYYQQYMSGGGQGNDGQGGSALIAAKTKPTGFEAYLSRYLPGQDHSSFVAPFTEQFSNSSAGYTHSAQYDQYVDRYSSMAGKHPAEAGSWQQHSAEQRNGFNSAVGGFLPSSNESKSNLVETPTSPSISVDLQLLQWVLIAFSLPSALAFVSILCKRPVAWWSNQCPKTTMGSEGWYKASLWVSRCSHALRGWIPQVFRGG